MRLLNLNRIFALFLIVFSCYNVVAQDENTGDDDNDSQIMEKKGFHFGLFVGPYWANKSTAYLYDGHGLDANGNYNEFTNSLIYNKIVMEYGGGYGQPDLIAQALGVDASNSGGNTWHFNASDMPQNMHYGINFLVGLNMRYSVDKKSAILININASKLKVTGNFTIETDVNPNQNQLNQGVNTFSIVGQEERMMMQFGYNRIIGNHKRVNLFIEGGLNATLAKFYKNFIQINNLTIDLTTGYIPPGSGVYPYQIYFPKHIGIGFGAFASAGLNLTMSPKWTVQLLYSPTYDKVNIGPNPSYKIQHACGFRGYYNF